MFVEKRPSCSQKPKLNLSHIVMFQEYNKHKDGKEGARRDAGPSIEYSGHQDGKEGRGGTPAPTHRISSTESMMNKWDQLKILHRFLLLGCGGVLLVSCIGLSALAIWISGVPVPEIPSEVALPNRPAISYSGKYRLSVIETKDSNGVWMYQFEIEDLESKEVFRYDEGFGARHTTFILWDENDRVWVYSGDIGTDFWKLSEEEFTWDRCNYDQNNPAPPYLKLERPRRHPW